MNIVSVTHKYLLKSKEERAGANNKPQSHIEHSCVRSRHDATVTTKLIFTGK